jgi:type IV secretory pathway VirB2 component (pilin)
LNKPRALRPVATLAIAILVSAVAASPALAQTAATSNIGTFIQNVIDLLNNNVIRGLAIVAIIITGVSWMFGHVDLRRASTVVVGIIVIFGAATIVDLITGASTGG